jgi:hypothetical protein
MGASVGGEPNSGVSMWVPSMTCSMAAGADGGGIRSTPCAATALTYGRQGALSILGKWHAYDPAAAGVCSSCATAKTIRAQCNQRLQCNLSLGCLCEAYSKDALRGGQITPAQITYPPT